MSGCASTGSIQNSGEDQRSSLPGYDTVVIETICEIPNSEKQRKLLHALVASGLQRTGRYKRVTGILPSDTLGSYLKVTERVKDLSKVSDGGRVLLGALAGQADIIVDVELTPVGSAVQPQHFQAVGRSSAGWVGAGTTDQALQRVAEQIVAEILKR